jgi:MYXO-CTERM domain-containing protein
MHKRAIALLALVTLGAAAPPVPEGATFTVFSRPMVTRFPDVAYDAATGAFLVVSGQGGVTGRFVAARGPEGDAFEITTNPSAYSPRVASTGDGFLVCWIVESDGTPVTCRSVRRGAVLGAEHVVDASGGKHLESAPSLACQSECLVTWVTSPNIDLRARRVALDGMPLGNAFDIAANAGVFEAFPAVAFGPARSEYLVVHTREPGAQAMTIAGARVSADRLAAMPFELYGADGLCNYPEVAHDPERDRFLSIAWVHEGNADVHGRLFESDGTTIGERIAVAASEGFEGGDGIGLAFDDGLDWYLAVYQGPETPGRAQEVWAAPVDIDGVPAPQFQATTAAAQNGIYQPRVTSDGEGRFLVVTVVDYARIDGQFVVGEVPAGVGGSAGNSGAGGGSESTPLPASTSDAGCGCRMPRPSEPPTAWWLVLIALFRARRSTAC